MLGRFAELAALLCMGRFLILGLTRSRAVEFGTSNNAVAPARLCEECQ